MKVKVCGLNNKSDFSSLSKLNIDFFGFIFYEKSPRYFFDHPIDMHKDLNSVGVFVNESIKKIYEIVESLSLKYVQLHGDEDVKYCKQIQKNDFFIFLYVCCICLQLFAKLFHLFAFVCKNNLFAFCCNELSLFFCIFLQCFFAMNGTFVCNEWSFFLSIDLFVYLLIHM